MTDKLTNKKEEKVYWGEKKICGSKKCMDSAWEDYEKRPQRRIGNRTGE